MTIKRKEEAPHDCKDPCDCPDCNPQAQQEPAGMIMPGPVDPWLHRSRGMTCKTCMWFVTKVATRIGTHSLGRCRRHAPTMNGYPVVFPTDWCGDHKLDEQKL